MVGRDVQRDEKSNGGDMINRFVSSDFETRINSITSNKDHIKESDGNKKLLSETKTLRGTAEIMEVANEILTNCKSNFDLYSDKNGPTFMIAISTYRELYARLKSKGVKIRLITEITKDNLKYCEEVIDKLSAEVKHLGGVRGNFAISDEKIYFGTTTLEEDKPVLDLIYSNAKGIVDQNQFIFETVWNQATPAEQRIREIEEGLFPVETRIVESPEEIHALILDITKKSNDGLSNCSTIGGFQMIYEHKALFNAYLNLLSRYKERKAQGSVRWITHIENNNDRIDLIKKFLNLGVEIRHVNNLPPMSFALSNKQFQGTIEKMEQGKMFKSVLYSTEPPYIKHFQLIFEEIWNSSINAEERIRQIKHGIASDHTIVIENPIQSKNFLLKLLEDAKEEIMIIFPSLNSVKRQSKIGLINLLKLKDQQNFRIKILSPNADIVKEIFLLEYSKEKGNTIDNVAIREISGQQEIKSTILIVDKKQLLTFEVRDNTRETFEEATGLATYSTSLPTLLSYISIFESLWTQTEMLDNLRVANEKLIESEEMEREFINTAAHELRTPTQAIMGYTELDAEIIDDILRTAESFHDGKLKSDTIRLHKHFDAISRNSERLNELINNLLDVARIESHRKNNLQLRKEKLDLIKEINESIRIHLDQKIQSKNIKINIINGSCDDQIWVYVDKSRLNQIINNLLDNAIKFSSRNGKIDITIKENDLDPNEMYMRINKTGLERDDNNNQESRDKKVSRSIFVSITDNGKGISPLVMPKLFEKFTTESDRGTGLGLYISRNIVEVHGGRIWGFNNKNGVGSTFVFSLPKIGSTAFDDT